METDKISSLEALADRVLEGGSEKLTDENALIGRVLAKLVKLNEVEKQRDKFAAALQAIATNIHTV